MPKRNSASSPEADDRFNTDVPAEIAERVTELLMEIDRLATVRPMAALRVCVKMQANLRTVERNAAIFGNHHFKISWDKIGELFGFTAQWAYKRYVTVPRQAALNGAIRLAKLSPAEMKEKPEHNIAESGHE